MRALDGEGEPMHCGRNTLKFPRFLGILAHAHTVCTRFSACERSLGSRLHIVSKMTS